MTIRSVRLTWEPGELKPSVEKAVKALKGSDTRLTPRTIAARARRHTNAPTSILESYIKDLSAEERAELGFPNPSADSAATGIRERTRPELGALNRFRTPMPRGGVRK